MKNIKPIGTPFYNSTHFGEGYIVKFNNDTFTHVYVPTEYHKNEKQNHELAYQMAIKKYPNLIVTEVYCSERI